METGRLRNEAAGAEQTFQAEGNCIFESRRAKMLLGESECVLQRGLEQTRKPSKGSSHHSMWEKDHLYYARRHNLISRAWVWSQG